MFSQACVKNSVHREREVSGRHPQTDTPLGRHPLQADTPKADRHPLQMATAADGTHPTGMHSCCQTLQQFFSLHS